MSEPQVARSIYMVEVADIAAGGGMRPLDETWVEGLMALLNRDGQRRPIEVYRTAGGHVEGRKTFGMIAGRHRLEAVRRLGWATIDADILDGSALDRRASEISENLFKLGLAPLDRATFVAEQIAVERARAGVRDDASPQSVAANARWADRIGAEADDASDILSVAYGWTDAVAEAVGLTPRTIRRDLALVRGIKPDVAEAIRALPVAQNAGQLASLAKMPEAEQRQVANLLVEGTATKVTEAVGVLRQAPVPSPATKAWSAIIGNWARLSAQDQKALLRELKLPRGVALTIDGEAIGD